MSPDSPDSPDTPRPIGEIVQGPSAFDQFMDRNQKNLIILTVIVAIAAAGTVIYRGIASSKEHTAGAVLNKAEDLTSLQGLIQEHSGTAAAASAQVLLAARQWSEGQQDSAIETLKKFIAGNAGHPARPTAQASLGSKLQAQGKMADAKKVFQELAEDPSARFLAPYALLSLGDIAKAAGETEQAAKFYQKAKNDFADSSFAGAISQRIAMLKAQMPVEIDAPPAPAAPATSIKPGAAVAPVKPASTPPSAVQPAQTVPPATEVSPVLPGTPGTPGTLVPAPVQDVPAAPRSQPDEKPAAAEPPLKP